MEKLVNVEEINLPTLMLEHMHRVMAWKKEKYGIPYGYLFNFVFNHFEVPLGVAFPGTTKQMFTKATPLECVMLFTSMPVCSILVALCF